MAHRKCHPMDCKLISAIEYNLFHTLLLHNNEDTHAQVSIYTSSSQVSGYFIAWELNVYMHN